ncbi:MAG TPA: hypothetical protein VGT44_17800 [Ktedonobacteraceae bacterium]|nr:hypothetical protein [Ktedonobacteraceae bacterium]
MEQVERFYRVWIPLLHYVNEQRDLVAPFPPDSKEARLPVSDIFKLRDALWADDGLRENYIATNPFKIAPADLALIESWRYRVSGNFYILRYLKKYTVFLSEKASGSAYGVLGLVSPIEEVIGPALPVYVRAVLLPFENHIIYDSVLSPYSIYFGPGIRSSLNDNYRDAQEREGIITNLLPVDAPAGSQEERKGILARNARIMQAFRRDMTRRGLSHSMTDQHAGNIDAFARDFLLTQDPPRGLLQLTPTDAQTYLQEVGSKTTITSFKRFVRFLTDSGRLDYAYAESLRDILKQVGD